MLIGRRNLSKEDRDELIRRLAASGKHTQKEIAAKLGLTRQAVTHIIGNKANNLPENPIKSTSAAEEKKTGTSLSGGWLLPGISRRR